MRTEYAGKVCVQFDDMQAAFSREFAKAMLMFGCCGSSFSADFYFIRLSVVHTHMCVRMIYPFIKSIILGF